MPPVGSLRTGRDTGGLCSRPSRQYHPSSPPPGEGEQPPGPGDAPAAALRGVAAEGRPHGWWKSPSISGPRQLFPAALEELARLRTVRARRREGRRRLWAQCLHPLPGFPEGGEGISTVSFVPLWGVLGGFSLFSLITSLLWVLTVHPFLLYGSVPSWFFILILYPFYTNSTYFTLFACFILSLLLPK